MIGAMLNRLFGRVRAEEEPHARLTAADAERIARSAAAGHWQADQLVPQGRRVQSGRLLWRFWTPSRGSSLEVEVDDVTGAPAVREFRGR